jgi:hypothetical protein
MNMAELTIAPTVGAYAPISRQSADVSTAPRHSKEFAASVCRPEWWLTFDDNAYLRDT